MISLAARRQSISLVAVLLSYFLHGCKMGWTSAAVSILMSENSPFEVTTQQISWIVSLPSLGDILSMFASIMLGKKFARKSFVTTGLCLTIITWAFASVARSPIFLMISVLFLGITGALLSIISGIYIAEISSPKNRSTFIALSGIIGMLGTELEFLILLWGNYRLLAIVPLIISIIAVISTIFMKESPYYLVSIGLREQARRNLFWLNGKDNEEDDSENFENLTQYIKEENTNGEGILNSIKIPDNYKVLLMIIVIRVTSLINTNLILLRSGVAIIRDFKDLDGELLINIFGVSRVCCTILSLFTMKKFGVRSLILSGFLCFSLIQLFCGICFFLEEKHVNIPYNHITIAALLLLIQITSYLTVIPAVNTLKTEVLPHNLKEFGMAVLKISISTIVFLVMKFFLPISILLGTSFNLFIFTIVNVFGGIYAYFYVKETKNKTLLEIRREYKSVNKVETLVDT